MCSSLPRHQRPTQLPTFLFGAPYYPEHWEPEDRVEDAQRMKEAGVNVVRMAEFAWDVIEPESGVFDFSLFDETIAHLGSEGISSVMCTPTATPPRWLTADKPEWMRVTSEDVRMEHGNRQHVCTNNEEFRSESQRITRVMAEHYRDNPHVTGWQIDNEFHCHFVMCYCPSCKKGFQEWLEQRYGSIDELNRRWGNRFWAQTYTSFDQIELPRHGRYPAPVNPSHELDHSRYLSDSLKEFQHQQVEILREVQPSWWITHNGLFDKIDHYDFVEDLDFYAVDVYPSFAGPGPKSYIWASMLNDSCRAASGGYIIPEQSGGPGGQEEYMHPTCEPGQMRLWAYQSIAHGADGILHFRWRSCRFGSEIYWNGIIDHDNKLRRRYDEFAQEGRELQRIGAQIVGSVKEVKMGILTGYLHEEIHHTLTNGFPGPKEQAKALYTEAEHRHLPVGLVDYRDSFEGLEIIIMPTFIAEDSELTTKLEAFVKEGGTLLVTGRSYTRTWDNHVLSATAPGALSGLLGITREEEGRIVAGMDEFVLQSSEGTAFKAYGGYEVLNLEGAQAIAQWNVGAEGRHPHFAQGKPGVTCHQLGKGRAFYFGSYVSTASASALLDLLVKDTTVSPLAQAEEAVEMTVRHKRVDGKSQRLLFVLNHSVENQRVTEAPVGVELLSAEPSQMAFDVEPFGVRIIALE